ncbi:hypothetical protein [Streptomyces sp. NBC_00045]|uniref:hypothetical protein n=1 Tax=Streptomyces sp. NBC_00045 TaxID=2975625 RepID=UPI0032553D55
MQRITSRRRASAEAWHRHQQEAAVARTRGARAAMVRTSPERAGRPTWSGDRIHAASVRIDRDVRPYLAAL